MYTEYIFSNKDYEMALRSIKAYLFDIVAREEANISSLREKAFSEDYGNAQASLQELFVRQDGCLRTILAISDQLGDALKKVDACSRDLKIIEKKAMEQFVAYVNENAAQLAAGGEQQIQEVPQEMEQQVSYEEQPVAYEKQSLEEKPTAIDGVELPVMDPVENVPEQVVEEATPSSEEEDVLMTYDDSLSTVDGETAPAEETTPSTEEEDVLMTYDDSLSTVDGATTPAEEATPSTEDEDVLMTYDDSLSTVEAESAPAEEATPSTEEEDVLMTYDDSLSTVDGETAPAEEATPSTEEEDVLMTYDDSLSTVDGETAPAEEATPSSEEEDVLMTYDDSLSTVDGATTPAEEATPSTEEDVLMTYDDNTANILNEGDSLSTEGEVIPTGEEDVLMSYDESSENILNEGDSTSSEDILLTTDNSETPVMESSTPIIDTTSTEDAIIEDSKAVLTPIESVDSIVTDPPASVEEPVLIIGSPDENGEVNVNSDIASPVLTIQPNDDVPVEEEPAVDEVALNIGGTSGVASEDVPLAIPASPEEVMMSTQEKKTIFKKKDDATAKVIMVSKKQFDKLKGSLSIQEASLRETGFFAEYDAIQDSNQQQIEELMNQANKLYSEGKVTEAQELFDQISALNNHMIS